MDQVNETLQIRVHTQGGEILFYSIHKHTPILKLLQKHCQRMDTHYKFVVFLIKGERFDHKKTPAQLKLKNRSLIDAFLPVDGGGRSEQ